jgi:hypothetical protein
MAKVGRIEGNGRDERKERVETLPSESPNNPRNEACVQQDLSLPGAGRTSGKGEFTWQQ